MNYLTEKELDAVVGLQRALNADYNQDLIGLVTFDVSIIDASGESIGNLEYNPDNGYVYVPPKESNV